MQVQGARAVLESSSAPVPLAVGALNKAETLLHQLKRRGFAVDAALEQRVQAASVAELDHWLDRVLDASRLEDVIDA